MRTIIGTVQIADPEAPGGYRIITRETTEPDPPPKYPTAAAAKTAVAEWITTFLVSVKGEAVPPDEVFTYIVQEDAARAIVAGTATDLQRSFLTDIAIERGAALPDLVRKIIGKANATRAIMARVIGFRGKLYDAIDAAQPSAYEGLLASAQAAAIAMVPDAAADAAAQTAADLAEFQP